MTSTHDRERLHRQRQLALGYRIFGALRYGDLGDGHITARDPERTDAFWLLRGGVGFTRATVADLLLIGPDGEILDGEGPFNHTAYYIHAPIHDARPDLVAAAHTHTPWGTPFSAERRLLSMITQEACHFHDDHAVFDDEEVQVLSVDGGKRIAAAVGDNRAVILANHGLLTTGASVGECVAAFVTMERVAEAQLKAPGAHAISAEAAQVAKDDLGPERSLENGFGYLVDRHVPDPTAVG
ncbi:MAG: class II aldolase/adducin family protein [Actinomycetota bacterium]